MKASFKYQQKDGQGEADGAGLFGVSEGGDRVRMTLFGSAADFDFVEGATYEATGGKACIKDKWSMGTTAVDVTFNNRSKFRKMADTSFTRNLTDLQELIRLARTDA